MATPCKDKKKYLTKDEALTAIDAYRQRIVLVNNELNAYPCDRHQCWHVGHRLTKEESIAKWKIMNWWKIPYEERSK